MLNYLPKSCRRMPPHVAEIMSPAERYSAPILKLPPELRVLIYEHLLPVTMIHIGTHNLVPYQKRKYESKSLRHSHCHQEQYKPWMWETDGGYSRESTWGEHEHCRFYHPPRGCVVRCDYGPGDCKCAAPRALMSTCRLM
jgi:hypothetical protein